MIRWLIQTGLAGFLLVLGAMRVGAVVPDEGQIAYVGWKESDRHIYLRDVTRALVVDLTGGLGSNYDPAWSADGTRLAFVSDRAGNREIFTQRVGCVGLFTPCGRDIRRITFNVLADHSPAWSPDGKQILYVVQWFQFAEIWVVDAAGGEPRALTNNEVMDGDAAWSPDGEWIVFASNRDNRRSTDLYLMNPRGGQVRVLYAAAGTQFRPLWSPDGRRILFNASTSHGYRLSMFEVDQPDEPKTLFESIAHGDDATWSPDGRAVAIVSVHEGQPDIYILPLDCADTVETCLRPVTRDPALELSPRWRPTAGYGRGS